MLIFIVLSLVVSFLHFLPLHSSLLLIFCSEVYRPESKVFLQCKLILQPDSTVSGSSAYLTSIVILNDFTWVLSSVNVNRMMDIKHIDGYTISICLKTFEAFFCGGLSEKRT